MTWETAFTIEQAMQDIMSRQAHYGVYFDQKKADGLHKHFTRSISHLEKKILKHFPLDLGRPYANEVKRPFKKDGSYSKAVLAWYPKMEEERVVSGPFSRITWTKLDLHRRTRVMDQLFKKGWRPTFHTAKGNPQITKDGEVCPNLLKLGEVGDLLTKFYITSHRKSQLAGWIESVRPDGRLSASAIVNGTNTGRMTHRLVVNVPKAADHVMYGKEMRELFCVPDSENGGVTNNRVMIGVDAKGLELRMLCHYMNDPNYTRILLNEDIHTYNQKLAGLPNRDAAKTFIYALIYGAGAAKLGSIIGGTARDGIRIKDKFLRNLPSLQKLIGGVTRASRRGYLTALDGRKVYLRKNPNGEYQTHKALNMLLQSGGSIVMKLAAVLFDSKVQEHKLKCQQVLNMHDEFQCEVYNIDAVPVRGAMLDSIVEAGEYFNLLIPLEGEVKFGKNWSQTH